MITELRVVAVRYDPKFITHATNGWSLYEGVEYQGSDYILAGIVPQGFVLYSTKEGVFVFVPLNEVNTNCHHLYCRNETEVPPFHVIMIKQTNKNSL